MRGSRSCAPTQATPPTRSTVIAGIDQTSISSRPEYVEIGQVAGALVGRAKPKGDAKRGEDRRDHDRQHDAERVEQDLPFGGGDGPFRIEDAFGAAAERRGADQDNGE